VRIEIESALAQKKRVIPVLVNDAKMPRSTELPEGLKPFARCNAVRLTHERFSADMQGLIKSLEDVLAELDAARKAESEEAQRKAKEQERAEAERLRQERRDARKRHATKPEAQRGETERPAPSFGVVRSIAELPSEINWSIPIALVAITFLGWIMPGRVFMPVEQGGFGWGSLSLVYGLGGVLALGVLLRLRRRVMDGAEFALYWLALLCFLVLVVLSLVRVLIGPLNLSPAFAALGIAAGVALIVLRRQEIGGLEFAVYWFGLTLFLYALGTGLVTSTFFRTTELGAFFEVSPLRVPAILISSAMVSALAILTWRNRRLSKPEAAVYLLGIAYWLYALARLG
jgi:hypothetical protein